MFVVVTLYGEWTGPLQRAQHVLFMVSGQSVPTIQKIWFTNFMLLVFILFQVSSTTLTLFSTLFSTQFCPTDSEEVSMTCLATAGFTRWLWCFFLLFWLTTTIWKTFAKAVSRKSEEISSHDFAEFNLVVNFDGNADSNHRVRKMKHVLPSEKRARIIDRWEGQKSKWCHQSFYFSLRALRSYDHKSASSLDKSVSKERSGWWMHEGKLNEVIM